MKNVLNFRILSLLLSICLLPPPLDAHEPVFGRKGMVVAQEPLAADVGEALSGRSFSVFDLQCVLVQG